MMSNIERLAYMANQIARNFATMRDEAAAAATADHIVAFWDPRMKAQILAHGEGLSPVAASAIGLLRDRMAMPAMAGETGDADAG